MDPALIISPPPVLVGQLTVSHLCSSPGTNTILKYLLPLYCKPAKSGLRYQTQSSFYWEMCMK